MKCSFFIWILCEKVQMTHLVIVVLLIKVRMISCSRDGLTRHDRAVHVGQKYRCRECDHQATSKGSITRHHEEVHKGKKYQCPECDHQVTSKGSLKQHQQAIHEGKKYPCRECGYQATSKGKSQ
jgi:DNA-directed RNA polymerase subunit RPC12/RpoP